MNSHNEALERLQSALEHFGTELGAAESHGLLVGLSCASGGLSRADWLARVAPGADEADLLAAEHLQLLGALYDETLQQLADSNLGFFPLLPDDDEALESRIVALAEWCQGFLLGMSEGGIAAPESMPGDAGEVLRDLVEIARADSYDLAEEDEDENAYAELLEYVRTAVLLLNEEMNPTKAAPLDVEVGAGSDDITYH